MYTAGPSQRAAGPDTPLRLAKAKRRAFDRPSASAQDPMLREYLTDMTRPYGAALREEMFDQPAGHFYGEMAAVLVSQTVSVVAPVDLIVFAYAIPDVRPGRSTAAHLSHLCPGRPMAFAVYDQGAAAPFTGLRLMGEYLRSGDCRRALLVVAEQGAVHYELPTPAAVPGRSTAVALLCGTEGAGRLDTVRVQAGVEPGRAAELLAKEIADLSTGRDETTLIAGNGLGSSAACDAVGQVIIAPPGQPCTGTWWELAGGLRTWTAEGRRVLLADYEPVLGYLCVSVFDIEAARPAAGVSGMASQASLATDDRRR
jgi:hypothetical protein